MFSLTKTERKALLVITAVILLSIFVQWMRPHTTRVKPYDYTMQDSLFKALSGDTLSADRPQAYASSSLSAPYHSQYSKHKESHPIQRIDLNKAGSSDLQRLPRIGPAIAGRILAYRKKHGSFKSTEELMRIKGIGPKTYKKIAPFVFIRKK